MDIEQLRKAEQKKQDSVKKSITTQLVALLQKDIRLFSKFGTKDKERFFAETGMLLTAGVDLRTALELSEQGSVKNKKLHKLYNQILQQIIQGVSLADAIAITGKFNNFDRYSVAIGESTGELNNIFAKLQEYYSRRIAQKRKITAAMSYPIIVLFTTLGAVMFMLKLVVPMFAQTLLQFGGELPAITKFVIYLSDHLSRYFTVLIIIVTSIGGYLYTNKNKDNVRKYSAVLLLSIPIWGTLMKKVQLAQFTASMSLLLTAKVNMYDSLGLTEKMTSFYPIQHALHKTMDGLVAGKSLYDCIKEEPIFDHKIVALVKIGEEINQLDTIFNKLSSQLQQEIDYQSNALIAVLEPLMILFLAIVIGVILIAMYLPMFKLGSVIN